MKTKVLMLAITLVAVAAFLAFSPVRPITLVGAQNRAVRTSDSAEPIELSPTKGNGADKNVKEARGKNSSKKSAATRGNLTCRVELENNTDNTIDIYVGGHFRNTMGPKDSSSFNAGSSIIYAKAEFDDGSYFYWGPRTLKCGDSPENGGVHLVFNP